MAKRKSKRRAPNTNKPTLQKSPDKLDIPGATAMLLFFTAWFLFLSTYDHTPLRFGHELFLKALPMAFSLSIAVYLLLRTFVPNQLPRKRNGFIGLASVIGLSLWVIIYAVLLTINVTLDKSSEQYHVATLISKDEAKGKSAVKTTYFFHFADWHTPASLHRVPVSRQLYERKPVGSLLKLTMKPGALGYEWILLIE